MTTATIPIRGDIGDAGLTDTDFAAALERAADADELRILLNSDGGNVFAALSMIAQLARFPGRVVTEVEGLAASAATFFLPVSDRVEFHQHAMAMIHFSMAGGIGNKLDLRSLANTLDLIDHDIASLYSGRTATPKAAWLAAMASELWLTSDDAKAVGLAQAIIPARSSQTSQRMARVANRSAGMLAAINNLKRSRGTVAPAINPQLGAYLKRIAARADEVAHSVIGETRANNRTRIVAHAKGERAAKYLKWS
jgi:ATP-dependent protease ClpP protease subunit